MNRENAKPVEEGTAAHSMDEWVDPETAKVLDSYNKPPPGQSNPSTMLGWVLVVVTIAVALGAVVALILA